MKHGCAELTLNSSSTSTSERGDAAEPLRPLLVGFPFLHSLPV
eukprot:SAG11_NODE_6860_length_1234_cov_1.463436_1_plen_42_part_10